jgi:hypothetical protein
MHMRSPVILDYGIKQSDGTWKLASDPGTTYATKADIAALAHPAGTPDQGPGQASWRVEDIQFNPLANLPVAQIGVYFINGAVKDYSARARASGGRPRAGAQVTDNVGSFYAEANDNNAWPERAFRFAGWEMVA